MRVDDVAGNVRWFPPSGVGEEAVFAVDREERTAAGRHRRASQRRGVVPQVAIVSKV
jgi:hypothetical protein